ncbi:Glycosyltransferase, GT2 family [Geodermatophilus amargosae]|uniref:Glycosyltransferase, GT2 family n=1 Tax=Geodermatophilus amargosae TaxID=1296565 RepID=A0A1I6X7I1_9ACTN|nr:glycosyltransferase [Geodermatophilus amargosae]SFT34260.1 Glycosyltransferase, GT2 family [Geodermatophilus amargosae]
MTEAVAQSQRFSIVIPTYQRRDVLVETIRALARLETPWPCELIVVVDGSTDGSAEAARAVPVPFPVRVLEQDNQGAAAARNHGAGEARGEVLLFLDDDMVADPRLLVEHDAVLRQGADAVIGHIPLHPDSPRTLLSSGVEQWARERHERLLQTRGQLSLGDLLTGQLSVRRDVFERAAGFDESFNARGEFGAEDTDFLHRLLRSGAAVRYAPGAVTHQRYVVTPEQNMRQWRQGGRADAVLVRKHPDLLPEILAAHRAGTPSGRLLSRWAHLVPSRLGRAVARPVVARAASVATGLLTGWAYTRLRDACYWRGVAEGGGFGLTGSAPVVLAYHAVEKVDDPVVGEWCVTPEQLEQHVEALTAAGFTFVGLRDVLDRSRGRAPLPPRSVLLTFDDAYTSLLDGALPVTAPRGIPAVVFVVSGQLGGTNRWDAERGAVELPLLDVDQLRRLVEEGWSLGVHSATHAHLTQQDAAGLDRELVQSLADLRATGLPIEPVLAYPFGEHDVRVRAATRRAGYTAAFALEGPRHPRTRRGRYAWPRIEVRRSTSPQALVATVLRPPRAPLAELERDARGIARRALETVRSRTHP